MSIRWQILHERWKNLCVGQILSCFAVNDLLVTRSQVSKLISNEISKYELKGTVDYLFHRISLTMAAVKIVQKLQIYTVLQQLPQSSVSGTALGSEPTWGKPAKSLCKGYQSILKVTLQIRHINADYKLNSLLSFMLVQTPRLCEVSGILYVITTELEWEQFIPTWAVHKCWLHDRTAASWALLTRPYLTPNGFSHLFNLGTLNNSLAKV